MRERWSKAREAWLRRLIKEENSRAMIARKMSVSINTIRGKAERLGIYDDIIVGYIPRDPSSQEPPTAVTLPGRDWKPKEEEDEHNAL